MEGGMNFPTSDVQFLAQVVERVIGTSTGVLTAGEAHRLEEIATKGFSSTADAPDVQEAEHE